MSPFSKNSDTKLFDFEFAYYEIIYKKYLKILQSV